MRRNYDQYRIPLFSVKQSVNMKNEEIKGLCFLGIKDDFWKTRDINLLLQ